MVYEGTDKTVPGGKCLLCSVIPGPGGTIRGRPSEDVECIRRVSLMTAFRLQEVNIQKQM